MRKWISPFALTRGYQKSTIHVIKSFQDWFFSICDKSLLTIAIRLRNGSTSHWRSSLHSELHMVRCFNPASSTRKYDKHGVNVTSRTWKYVSIIKVCEVRSLATYMIRLQKDRLDIKRFIKCLNSSDSTWRDLPFTIKLASFISSHQTIHYILLN